MTEELTRKEEYITSLLSRIAYLENALLDIMKAGGKVCDEYETCAHAACASSHMTWALAEKALRGD